MGLILKPVKETIAWKGLVWHLRKPVICWFIGSVFFLVFLFVTFFTLWHSVSLTLVLVSKSSSAKSWKNSMSTSLFPCLSRLFEKWISVGLLGVIKIIDYSTDECVLTLDFWNAEIENQKLRVIFRDV